MLNLVKRKKVGSFLIIYKEKCEFYLLMTI